MSRRVVAVGSHLQGHFFRETRVQVVDHGEILGHTRRHFREPVDVAPPALSAALTSIQSRIERGEP